MKLKNKLIILAISLFSIIGCHAIEVSVENPYRDIAITSESKLEMKSSNSHQCRLSGGSTSWAPISGNIDRRDYEEASFYSFALFLKANKQLLTQRSYDATTQTLPGGPNFEESFSINNQQGKIIYKAEVEFGVTSNQKVIKAIKIKVLKATLDGVELTKTSY